MLAVPAADLILDDAGLRKLLKLPEGADLEYYRQRGGLPYTKFRVEGKAHYRYLTTEVLQRLCKRQHGGDGDNDFVRQPERAHLRERTE